MIMHFLLFKVIVFQSGTHNAIRIKPGFDISIVDKWLPCNALFLRTSSQDWKSVSPTVVAVSLTLLVESNMDTTFVLTCAPQNALKRRVLSSASSGATLSYTTKMLSTCWLRWGELA